MRLQTNRDIETNSLIDKVEVTGKDKANNMEEGTQITIDKEMRTKEDMGVIKDTQTMGRFEKI